MGGWYSDGKLTEYLMNYPVLKAQAAIEAEELRHLFPNCTSNYDPGARRGGLPDETGAFAVRREAWSQNMRRARAIEIALAALSAQERELIGLLYFERWGRYQTRLRMGLKRSQFFNIRRRALDKLAGVLLG